MEFYSEKRVTAKKEHRCCGCGKTIEVGEEYYRQSGKWRCGVFFSNAYCVTCAGAIADYCYEMGREEVDYDAVAEHTRHKFCDNCPGSKEECGFFVLVCPKIVEHYRTKLGRNKK